MNKCSGKVLVVDDEEPLRKICERTLSVLGAVVTSVEDAEKALTLLDRERFDCVLTDISMPGARNGAVLTEEIKARFPSTDVIIMTGSPSVETSVFTLKQGALDYLIKPFDSSILQNTVVRCLERRRLSPELDKENIARHELAAAYVELQKVERRMDSFMSIVSHELRTPLAAAISAADLLRDEGLSQDKKIRLFDLLDKGLAQESGVVEELLAYSALRSGGVKPELWEVDLGNILREIVENFRILWEEKQLSVRIDVSPEAQSIWADPAMLRTAFKHLLLNAIQFNRKGGRITISARSGGDAVRLTFADSGIGIPPEARGRLFDGFYQVADYMTRDVGGLGLGLAIVRQIVEAHGGSIALDSWQETASSFKIFLPRRQSNGVI